MVEAEGKTSTIEFEIEGGLVDAILSGNIENLVMGLSTGMKNVIEFYTQLKSGTNPLKESDEAEVKVAMFNTQYNEAIKDKDTKIEAYLKANVTYEKNTNSTDDNNKFHPYTITVSVTPEEENEKQSLIIKNEHLKETVVEGGGKTRKGGRKHKRKQRKSAKRKSSRKRKTK